jgi:hypothetical protein
MTYKEIPTAENRPSWLIAFSTPFREVVSGDDNEKAFDIIKQHFQKRGAMPDVAARFNGRIYVGAQ